MSTITKYPVLNLLPFDIINLILKNYIIDNIRLVCKGLNKVLIRHQIKIRDKAIDYFIISSVTLYYKIVHCL